MVGGHILEVDLLGFIDINRLTVVNTSPLMAGIVLEPEGHLLEGMGLGGQQDRESDGDGSFLLGHWLV